MKLDNKVIENPYLVRDSLSTQLLLFLFIISGKRKDGMIITTRKELSESTYISESSIQRRLKKLEDLGFIVQTTSNTQRKMLLEKGDLSRAFESHPDHLRKIPTTSHKALGNYWGLLVSILIIPIHYLSNNGHRYDGHTHIGVWRIKVVS